jgi:hypothetical protein
MFALESFIPIATISILTTMGAGELTPEISRTAH